MSDVKHSTSEEALGRAIKAVCQQGDCRLDVLVSTFPNVKIESSQPLTIRFSGPDMEYYTSDDLLWFSDVVYEVKNSRIGMDPIFHFWILLIIALIFFEILVVTCKKYFFIKKQHSR